MADDFAAVAQKPTPDAALTRECLQYFHEFGSLNRRLL
jgi:hypothetical protein